MELTARAFPALHDNGIAVMTKAAEQGEVFNQPQEFYFYMAHNRQLVNFIGQLSLYVKEGERRDAGVHQASPVGDANPWVPWASRDDYELFAHGGRAVG
jgi:hypothetical protein